MRGIWKKEENRMVEKEKEREMGEDEEMDRHRRISKEQRELLQSQLTTHQKAVQVMGTSVGH